MSYTVKMSDGKLVSNLHGFRLSLTGEFCCKGGGSVTVSKQRDFLDLDKAMSVQLRWHRQLLSAGALIPDEQIFQVEAITSDEFREISFS